MTPTTCSCGGSARVTGPVDRIDREHGLRLRHIPGEICLRCRDITVPPVEPTADLRRAIDSCLHGRPEALTIVKAGARPELGSAGSCSICRGELEHASLDVGLGMYLGLVVEDVPGAWCWRCHVGVIHNDGEELRQRLACFDENVAGDLAPSLLYDTPSHPRSMQFEITTRCNLRCDYCTHRLLPEHADIPVERFERLLDRIDLSRVDNIDFTGLGEPVMHPELPAMVRMVRERSKPTFVRVVTNGTILTPKRYEPLCEAGITTIAFSIDSLDPEVFARNRGGARLDIVLRNLESLVAYRERRGLDDLHIRIKSVLLDGDPFAEAERILRYSAERGLECPHFSCLDERSDAVQGYDQNWLTSRWAETDGERLARWADERWRELTAGPERSGKESGPSAAERAAGFSSGFIAPPPDLCRWAVDAAFVSATGEALACCEQMIDIPRMYWSSFDRGTMEELWTGDLFWGYRLPLALGYVPKGCVGCSRAPAGGIAIPIELQRTDRTMLPVL
jgi:molybdenum cofactor biosynthesis enzyme MoaA